MNGVGGVIGLKNSSFSNVNGYNLSENKVRGVNTSSAFDIALLFNRAMNLELFAKIMATKEYKCKSNPGAKSINKW